MAPLLPVDSRQGVPGSASPTTCPSGASLPGAGECLQVTGSCVRNQNT